MTLEKDVQHGVPVFKTLRIKDITDASTESAMRLQFTISNEQVDRDGDSIDVKGWTLDNFTKNPVVCWAHQYDKLPLGRALKTWKAGDELKSLVEFSPDFLYDDNYHGIRGSTVFRFYKNGYLSAVSAGFYPQEWTPMTGKGAMGTHFEKQDLIEFSFVPVPSNPNALVQREGFNQTEIKAMKKELNQWVKTAQELCQCPTEKALGADDDTTGGALVPPGDNNEGDEKMKKGGISFKEAHADGTPLAEPDEKWNAAAERAKCQKAAHLKAIHAAFSGGDDADKNNYDFPHHAGGEPPNPVHLKAVKKIAKAFTPAPPDDEDDGKDEPDENEPEKKQTSEGDEPGLGYTQNDNKVIMDHMAQHLTEFKEPIPWDTSVGDESGSDTKKKSEPEEETKGAIPYHKYPLSTSGSWDGPAQVAAAEVDDLKKMCAWFDSENPETKSSYKLPHHMADGFATVKQGVVAAGGVMQGARGGAQIPAGDVGAVKSHLAKHYAEFDMTAPWEAKAEAGDDKTEDEDEEEEPVTPKGDAKKALEDLEVTKIGRTLSKANADALNEALGHFSEGFGQHDKGLQFHEKVTKAHAKALDAHEEAMKCYQKGADKLKSVLKAMGDKPDEGSEAEEQAETPEEEAEEQGKPTKAVEPEPEPESDEEVEINVKEQEPEDDVITFDPELLVEVVKETVDALRKELGLLR